MLLKCNCIYWEIDIICFDMCWWNMERCDALAWKCGKWKCVICFCILGKESLTFPKKGNQNNKQTKAKICTKQNTYFWFLTQTWQNIKLLSIWNLEFGKIPSIWNRSFNLIKFFLQTTWHIFEQVYNGKPKYATK